MLEQTSGLGKLAPWKTKKIESYVRTLSLQVPREASGRLGDVQGLIGAVSNMRTGNILSANIEEAFSDGLNEAIKTLPFSANLETTFETAVGRVNMMLQRLLGDHGLPVDPADTHGVIIAQKGRDVAAAVWGRPSLILFRRGVEGGPKLFDVLDAEADETAAQSAFGFNNLISGKISGKDRMVIANRNLLELLERRALQEILSAPRTDTVTMLLRDALVARHENLDLAMLLLDGHANGEDATEPATTEETTVETEDKTEEKKSRPVAAAMPASSEAPPANNVVPPGVPETRQKNELNLAKRTSAMQKMLTNAKKGLDKATAATVASAKSAGKTISQASKAAGEKALNAVTVEKGDEPKPEKPAEAKKKSVPLKTAAEKMGRWEGEKVERDSDEKPTAKKERRHPLDYLVDRWNSLNGLSQKLFLGALVLIVIANASVGALGWNKQQEQAVADYEKTVSTIRQQLDSAEASMIYRDEERARRLLDEAAAAVALLPIDSDERAGTKTNLEEELLAKYAGLRHAMILEAPEVLSTVVTPDGAPKLTMLTEASGVLWAAAAGGAIFKIAEDGSAEGVHTLEAGEPEIFTAHKNGILAGTKDFLYLLSPNGQATPLKINAGDYELAIDDVATFGSRLYLLDSSHNRILKFASVPGGYSSPAVYVKDGTDLSNAASLTIDGYVFWMAADGTITKMLSGNSQDYAVDATDPPLVSPVLMRTASEDSDLYVLDTGHPRVVRYDKENGNVLAQYESDELSGATDMRIDEANNAIIVTKDNRVLRFTWTEEE